MADRNMQKLGANSPPSRSYGPFTVQKAEEQGGGPGRPGVKKSIFSKYLETSGDLMGDTNGQK